MTTLCRHALSRAGLAVCVLLCLSIGACSKSPAWQLQILDPATGQNHTLRAADAKHKRIFINYWAEWCKPCLSEIPELNRFAQAHPDTLILLGYNFDNKKGETLLAASRKIGMAFPSTLTDPATVFVIAEVAGLPTTLVLDEQGRLITALMGPQTLATLEQALSL